MFATFRDRVFTSLFIVLEYVYILNYKLYFRLASITTVFSVKMLTLQTNNRYYRTGRETFDFRLPFLPQNTVVILSASGDDRQSGQVKNGGGLGKKKRRKSM